MEEQIVLALPDIEEELKKDKGDLPDSILTPDWDQQIELAKTLRDSQHWNHGADIVISRSYDIDGFWELELQARKYFQEVYDGEDLDEWQSSHMAWSFTAALWGVTEAHWAVEPKKYAHLPVDFLDLRSTYNEVCGWMESVYIDFE